MKNKLFKQSGFTLVEIMAGLFIFGVVLAGALKVFGGASSSVNGLELVSDISTISSAVKSKWSQSNSYGTANMLSVLDQAKRLPTTWKTSGTGSSMTATAPGGIAVGIKGQTSSFAITLDGVTPDICAGLLERQGGLGWINVYTAAAAGSVTPLTTGALSGFDPATVSTACGTSKRKITLVGQ